MVYSSLSKHNERLLAFDILSYCTSHVPPAVVRAAVCARASTLPVSVVVETEKAARIQIHSQIHRGIAVSEYCWFV